METNLLEPPDQFPFPFQPYDIQKDFMKALYETIEKGQIGIFESPTGTGKSLSMICGAFKWLQDHQHRIRDENLPPVDEDKSCDQQSASDEPSWINDFLEKKAKEEVTKKNSENEKREERRVRTLKKLRKGKSVEIFDTSLKFARKRKNDADDATLRLMEQSKRELEGNTTTKEMVDPKELKFLPEDCDSDEDRDDLDEDAEEDDFEDMTRIYFCSRTHTQLSQFVHEIVKSPYNPATNKQPEKQVDLDLTMTTIASRNSLCVNEAVKSLKSLSLINERCLDLQSNSKKGKAKEPTVKRRKPSASSCPYVKNVEGKTKLVGEILSRATDVEELANIGRQHQACPYYAARKAANYSQLVLLPYQAILHKETRLASNVRLNNSVVIIDEAHNLIEAINTMHSCQISLNQVKIAWGQLSRYHVRYSKMLAARNLFYVKQLLHVLKCFGEVMKPASSSVGSNPQTDSSEVKSVVDFLSCVKLDNVNWFKLVRYCQESKISRKLNGFVEKHEQVTANVAINRKSSPTPSKLADFLQNIKHQGAQQQEPAVMEAPKAGEKETLIRCPLQNIEAFFQSLASASEDGRILITRNCLPSPKLKFLLLNPAQHFKVLLDECRSVIIAGGTMKPSSILINQLLATGDMTPSADMALQRARFVEFSCGHVVDGSTQLLPALLKRAPSGQEFDFSYERQSNTGQIDQLGRTLLNICQILPGGVVCFFPSYKFSKVVHQRWKSGGLIERIEKKKKVFCETQNDTSVDSVLERYRRRIEDCKANSATTENGAVLLSVVGGKLSEGINFSDDLGRCVMMIGLPYPNIKSVELQEKMKYLDANLPRSADGMKPSSIYYEELCMKAVNQSIGRAIRHKNDYACILLVDKRFARSSVQSKLPDWISNHMKVHESFGTCFSSIRKFFLEKSKAK